MSLLTICLDGSVQILSLESQIDKLKLENKELKAHRDKPITKVENVDAVANYISVNKNSTKMFTNEQTMKIQEEQQKQELHHAEQIRMLKKEHEKELQMLQLKIDKFSTRYMSAEGVTCFDQAPDSKKSKVQIQLLT